MNCIFRKALLIPFLLFAANAHSAPVAYSVNSDSGTLDTMDSLYKIDLSNGSDTRVGKLFNGLPDQFLDTEGLAFAPDGVLWGIDDDSRTLFPINTENGIVSYSAQIRVFGFPTLGGNDFGMTFSCDNTLYVSSGRTGSLHSVDMDGNIETIGALGVNISAMAAYGNPTQLFGLGNGQTQKGAKDAPNLYSIDTGTGVATLVGELGSEAGGYTQGGLAFDEDGDLWAITDRSIVDGVLAYLPSQILNIDKETGAATLKGSTTAVGFESLAIAPPSGCEAAAPVLDLATPIVPTLDTIGRLLAIFVLLLGGIISLRRRFS